MTPFLILIVLQAVESIRLFRTYRREQMDDMQRERDALKKEREASEAMMQELLALKASMQAQAPPSDGAQNNKT